jgi:hypothetical protein
MAVNYCDMIHNLAGEIPTAIPLKPHDDLWPIPEATWWQSGDFYRKFARAFEDIARDIEDGHEPDPHNMAEEIALRLALDAAAGVVADEGPELDLVTGECLSRASILTSTCSMMSFTKTRTTRLLTSETAASRSLAILMNGSRTSRPLRQGILGEGPTGRRCGQTEAGVSLWRAIVQRPAALARSLCGCLG